jgi:hypothetical protein
VSGLLKRLAGQAIGAQAPQAMQRVRPAMSMHAQVPAFPTREDDESMAEPRSRVPAPDPSGSQIGRASPPRGRDLAFAASTSGSQSPRAHQAMSGRSSRTETDEHRSHEVTTNLPQPLFDEVPITNLPAGIAVAAPAPVIAVPPREHSRNEPTEVHVHIGRIEVIAAPEPVAPKKSRQASRETLPLSDYLARRRQS